MSLARAVPRHGRDLQRDHSPRRDRYDRSWLRSGPCTSDASAASQMTSAAFERNLSWFADTRSHFAGVALRPVDDGVLVLLRAEGLDISVR